MQQLYLPTSSLNFNAAFAEEALSPAAYYARRGFGYKRFETVSPNPHANSLLLYDKYPHFDIQDSDRENLPIVFTLEDLDDNIVRPVHTYGGVTVYQTDRTLYLTPMSTSVLFRNKADLTAVGVASRRSLETKLADLYHGQGCFGLQSDEPSFDWNPKFTDPVSDMASHLNEETLLRHRRLDQLKGFMYAYALGAVAATPPHLTELIRIARNVRNTALSILGGLADTPRIQWETLLASLIELDREYNRRHDSTKSVLDGIALTHQQAGVTGLLEDILSFAGPEAYHRLVDTWKREKALYYPGTIYDILRRGRGDSINQQVQQALSHMDQTIAAVQAQGRLKKGDSVRAQIQLPTFAAPDLNLATVTDPVLNQMKADDGTNISTLTALCALVNELLAKQYTVGDLIADRFGVAKTCGLAIKNGLKTQQWEGSGTERYVNGLLKNVALGEPFDITSSNSLLLRSYAAFVLKGDDTDKLQDFVVAGRIGDFRIALGMHGALAGFSALPRTALNALYSMEDLTVIDRLYQQIHAALHGRCPQGHLTRKTQPAQTSTPRESNATPDVVGVIHDFEQLLKTKKIPKAHLESFKATIAPDIESGKNVDQGIAMWGKRAKVPKKDITALIKNISRLFSSSATATPKTRMAVEQTFDFSSPPRKNAAASRQIPLFVEDQICMQDLRRDGAVLDCLAARTRDALAESLIAFQQKYKVGGFYDKKPDSYQRDNKSTIDHFTRCLVSDKTKELNVPLSSDQRSALTRWLRDRYGC